MLILRKPQFSSGAIPLLISGKKTRRKKKAFYLFNDYFGYRTLYHPPCFLCYRGGEWNSGGQCSETEPMKTAPADSSENPPMMKTIESVIKRMKTPVFYLNISTMTDFRPDAHPSMYRNANMSEETKKFTLTHQDCSHWCLPGVPDLWNELVYAHLLQSMKRNNGNP
jgi:hypothetical protein